MKLMSPFRCGSPSSIWFLFPPRAWLLPECKFLPPICDGREHLSSLHWLNSGVGNEREGVYLLVTFSVLCPLGWSSDVFGYLPLWRKVQRDHLFRFHTIPKWEVPLVEGTYFWSNVFGHLLLVYFLFLTAPFMLSRTVHFVTPFLIFQAHFFLFLQHVFIRNLPNFLWCFII